ncbi:MAG: pyridoxamine 5'-phosphate oxidase family protein [Gammaproteobacteria bacterium]|nr:pyridoxamine 5'-phosphate oxidase family protein [Gammaproteobacteria bacterium]
MSEEKVFTSEAELRAAFGNPMELAIAKARPKLDKYSKAFIERSPLACIATCDERGRTDVSPRGDQPGFVLILDDHTLYLPERPGNNRYDTLTNLLKNPCIGMVFFVPGYEDMLRVNGRATLVDNPELAARSMVNGKKPKVGIKIAVEEAYLHCAKALRRSKIWDPSVQRDRRELPSIARMILEQSQDVLPPEPEIANIDALVEENYRTELY